MNAEDQINMLKQIPPVSRREKRRKIVTAIVLAVSTLMTVLFFVYAMLQGLEANKQKEFSEQIRVELEKARDEAERAKQMAMAAQIEAEKQRSAAEEALRNCNKSK